MSIRSKLEGAVCALLLLAASSLVVQAGSIDVNGVQRTFILDGAGARPKPLIIALHGGGGSAERFRERSGLAEEAIARGFAIVWPESDGGHWNDGRLDPRGRLVAAGEDEAFLLNLVDQLVEQGIADKRRIYVTGHSNGGMMSFTMGCKHPGLFRAMAPVSANVPLPMACAGRGPIATLNVVGLGDRVVPFQGGGIFGGKRRGELMSVEDTWSTLQLRNGCIGKPAIARGEDVQVLVGKGCKAETRQLRLKGQGHFWPKDAAKRIVAFFK